MDISSFMGGNYFSQLDLASPTQLMTIGKVDQQMVGQGPQAEQKICATFNESAKPLALNKTNLKRIAALYGTDASQWNRKQLLVYRSSTTYGGEPKLCVRVCGPQQAPPDPICDQHGNAVPYQPLPTAPVAAPQAPAALHQQQPQSEQPQQPSPWEQPAAQDNDPPAEG